MISIRLHVPCRIAAALLVFVLIMIVTGLAGASARDTWKQLEEGAFSFEFRPEEEKLAHYLLDYAEEAWSKITDDLGLDRSGRVKVVIASSASDLVEAVPSGRRVPGWAVGSAFPDENLILIKSPKLIIGGQPYFERVFIHELAHVALGRALSPRRIPRWLHEGFAIREAGEWSISRGTLLTRAVLSGSLIPLRRLTEGFPWDDQEVKLAYAESADLVGYIFDKYGKEGFQAIVRAMADGHEFDRAVRKALSVSIYELEQGWRRNLRRRYSWVPIITSSVTVWGIVSLVLIAGYLRKRRSAREQLELWEKEEYEEDGGWMH